MQTLNGIFKKHFFQCVFIAVPLLLFLSANRAYAAPLAHQKAWKVVPSPNVGTFDRLAGVAAVSATNVWAVGNYTSSGQLEQSLIEHWDGSSWSIVSSPNVKSGNNYLNGITAVSANDIWAVGYSLVNQYSQPLIEYWDGTRWRIFNGPSADNGYLDGIAVVSATDIWAVGFSFRNGNAGTLVEHWDGTLWNIVPSPNDPNGGEDTLTGIAVVSANDIWAVGYAANLDLPWFTVTEHWDGTKWSYVDSPFIQGEACMVLTSVASLATNDIWAVGISSSTNQICYGSTILTTGLIDHWNGTQWTVNNQLQLPESSNSLNGIAAISPTDIWAVGSNGSNTLTYHWDGTSWHIVNSPSPGNYDSLRGVTAIIGNGLWAVGNKVNQTLTEFSNA